MGIVGGLTLILLTRGLWQRRAVAWQWALGVLLLGGLGAASAGAPVALDLYLAALALVLIAARGAFNDRDGGPGVWQSPALAILVAVTLASSFWLIARG